MTEAGRVFGSESGPALLWKSDIIELIIKKINSHLKPFPIENLHKKLQEIKSKLKLEGFKCHSSFSREWWKNDAEYGIYVTTKKDEYILWIGLWTKFWKEHGYPFTIGVHINPEWLANSEKFFMDVFPQNVAYDGYRVISFDESLLMEDSAEKILSIIRPYLDKVRDYGI